LYLLPLRAEAANNTLLSDFFSAALQTSRKALRYIFLRWRSTHDKKPFYNIYIIHLRTS
jgi:hypothetical protein